MRVRVLWSNPLVRELLSGEVYDLPDEQARRMLDANEAELVEVAPAASIDPLDHDSDGRKGGSLPKAKRKPKG
jgi:hypothetical protein